MKHKPTMETTGSISRKLVKLEDQKQQFVIPVSCLTEK